MYLSVINNRFERVIQESFGKLLSGQGYGRQANQFYLKSERVGKLITVRRGLDHPYPGQVAMFTLHVQVASDDFWAMNYPTEAIPVLPTQDHRYYLFHRHLGQFYSKQGGERWLALDGTVPEPLMIGYLRELLQVRILPYLNKFDSLDGVLAELAHPSMSRMQMLAWLGRRQEAYAELQRLIARRHQKGYRISMVEYARRLGILD